ncbi:glutaredoxin family protein [Rhodopirellula sallentina]|uniref:Putative membrane protein n=1 Tax=Rhodopirellula sallentina SM41 TaxID=1263870 RepID=M5U5X6_9BACT|nr:putative membrane protein [Rhodopirellula sallentina]EMI53246.1 putative membrane protein [Rhodopirellula sallentina SM41]
MFRLDSPHRDGSFLSREIVHLVGLACLCCAGMLFSHDVQAEVSPQTDSTFRNEQTNATSGTNTVQMEVFLRGDVASATDVRAYVADLRDRTTGLEVIVHDVVKDRSSLVRLYQLTKRAGRDKPVVPAFHCCDRMYFGFEGKSVSGPAVEALFTADVYTRSTCPRCGEAKIFLKSLQKRWPAVRFRIHEITGDESARLRWEALCRGSGSAPGLPLIDFGRSVIIGYQGDQVTGRQIEDLIRKKARIENLRRIPAPAKEDLGGLPLLGVCPTLFGVGFLQDAGATKVPEQVSEQQTRDEQVIGGEVLSEEEFDFDLDDLALPEEASASETGEAGLEEPVENAAEIESIEVPVFGELRVRDLGMPLFSFLVGLVDGFNPCAMWVLVFLLSVLVNIKDRRKIILIAGTFVLVSGIAYYAFMAAWLSLFLFIGIARPVQIALGALAIFIGVINVKDFFAFKKGISLSIPESQKPGLYRRVRKIVEAKYLTAAVSGAVALAVIVNMVELLCTAGLPALYTQVLTLQELPAWQNHLYLLIYILAYMLDDLVLLSIVVITLSHRKLQEREGRWLKLLSGVVILALGLCMLFRPEWLQLGQ